MSFASASADVRPEHDMVRSVSSKVILIKSGGQNLDIATSAVNILFELLLKLNYKVFSFIREFGKPGTNSIESVVFTSLDALILLSIAIPFTGSPFPFTLGFFLPI